MPQSTEGYFRHRKIEGKHMFNKRVKVKDLLTTQPENQDVTVMGWVRTMRNNQFIALNDGSTNNNLQVVAELGAFDEQLLKKITPGASLKVQGQLVASLGKGQAVEVKAHSIEVLGECNPDTYPLQLKNKPSLEYLREIAHLRFHFLFDRRGNPSSIQYPCHCLAPVFIVSPSVPRILVNAAHAVQQPKIM